MIVKVVLKTMQNARKLVSIVEPISCDVELCCGRYVVNAKSMLGVLSMPDFEKGELHVHTDNDKECELILDKLLEADLLMDTNDAVCRSIYDITVFGEILFDFTSQRLNEDGQMLYARNPGADTQIQKEELDVDILDQTNIFHIGSLSLTDQPARDTTFYAVKRAKNKGSIISYDPNYRASLWENEEIAKEHMRSLIPYVDIMKISDEETELLSGYKKVPEAAEELYRQGAKIVAITLGRNGTYIYNKEGGRIVNGFAVEHVADTNGAGDSFWGSFLYKLSQSDKRIDELTLEELAEYARFGNAAASLCVEKKGAIPAMPKLSQVEERLEDKKWI